VNEPAFIITKEERTRGGSLPGPALGRVADLLARGGYALLPSDTCYSLAALPPDSDDARNRINTVLGRPDIPISLAFPSLTATRQWIARDPVVVSILKNFCPGPITVICAALHEEMVIPRPFFEQAIRVLDRTVGVRIPDSIVERDVAACTEFPVTTVAVRTEGYKDIIQDFGQALQVFRSGMDLIERTEWCALEALDFYAHNSTIIRVPGQNSPADNVRDGDIPFTEIEAHIRRLLGTAGER
jgi:L-threonylcarbamoyladenylate synthase